MNYSIGETATLLQIPASTLRYYEKMGLLLDLERSSGGNRVFSGQDIDTLQMIECLKTAGLTIKEIRDFLVWCKEGDATLQRRQQMFHERREALLAQMETLRQTLDKIEYKCWYYDMAVEKGTAYLEQLPDEDYPPEMLARRKLFER